MRRQILLLALLALLASPTAAQTAPVACSPISVDTTGWHAQGSAHFGTRFLAPPRYQRKVWESRGSNMPTMDSTDAEDYWPNTGVLWTFTFATTPAASLTVPQDAEDYQICVEPWSSKRGTVERFRAGRMSTGPSTFATPYVVRASWRLPGGRLLTFNTAGTDSGAVAEMYGLIATLRFRP